MTAVGDVFHLAVPSYDLRQSEQFYVDLLGCKLARRYEDRITVDFFGDQLVCHLTVPAPDYRPGGPLEMYPRHFGITFRHAEAFEAVHSLAVRRSIPFFSQMSVRFGDRPESHRTFMLRDPSDNLVEFKQYDDPRMMY